MMASLKTEFSRSQHMKLTVSNVLSVKSAPAAGSCMKLTELNVQVWNFVYSALPLANCVSRNLQPSNRAAERLDKTKVHREKVQLTKRAAWNLHRTNFASTNSTPSIVWREKSSSWIDWPCSIRSNASSRVMSEAPAP